MKSNFLETFNSASEQVSAWKKNLANLGVASASTRLPQKLHLIPYITFDDDAYGLAMMWLQPFNRMNFLADQSNNEKMQQKRFVIAALMILVTKFPDKLYWEGNRIKDIREIALLTEDQKLLDFLSRQVVILENLVSREDYDKKMRGLYKEYYGTPTHKELEGTNALNLSIWEKGRERVSGSQKEAVS